MNSARATLLLFACLLLPALASGQSSDSFLERSLEENDIRQRLPSLDSLMQAALLHSPLLKQQDAARRIAELRIQSQKRDWMRYVGLNFGYSYGRFDIISANTDAAVGVAATTSAQSRYNIGFYIRAPLNAIANRNLQIQVAEAEAEQVLRERQSAEIELRQLVIVQYQNLVKAHRMMLLASNSLQSKKLLHSRAEREYFDGQISLSDYSQVQEMLNNSIELFEDRKIEFTTAYLILQETTGQELNF